MAFREKRSISMPPDLDTAGSATASTEGPTDSGRVAEAAELTIRAGLAAVADFEQGEGAFTPDERADADAWARATIGRSSRSGRRTRRPG